jgi:hypothetical protein
VDSKDPRSGGRECPYCQLKQGPRIHDKKFDDDYHDCVAIGQQVPFISVGIKGKSRKHVITNESVPMMSYGETPGAHDPSMGGPTRGRR